MKNKEGKAEKHTEESPKGDVEVRDAQPVADAGRKADAGRSADAGRGADAERAADAERQKQIDEIMEALPHPDDDKTPWLVYSGLAAGVIGWLLLFILPDGNLESLNGQLFILLGFGLAGLLLSIFGRKRAMALSLIGMIVSASLMLFAIIGLIVLLVIK